MRNGGRRVSSELATKLVAQNQAMVQKARVARGLRPKPLTPQQFEQAVAEKLVKDVPFISDATIRFEMSIFATVMQYAMKKRYIPASQRFDKRPKLKKMWRNEFTKDEYTALYTFSRGQWIREAPKDENGNPKPGATVRDLQIWSRTVAHNFVLVMCNTGMRPSEAKNLRWRDVTTAKDSGGRDLAVLFVQGKGKSRKLVAPESVTKYL